MKTCLTLGTLERSFAFLILFCVSGLANAQLKSPPKSAALQVLSESVVTNQLPDLIGNLAVLPDRKPRAGSIQQFNTPAYWWPAVSGVTSWMLEVRHAGESPTIISSVPLEQNWFNSTEILAPGHYQWRVRPLKLAKPMALSAHLSWYDFTVASEAIALDALRFDHSAILPNTINSKLSSSLATRSTPSLIATLSKAPWLNAQPSSQSGLGAAILANLERSNAFAPALEAAKLLVIRADLADESSLCKQVLAYLSGLPQLARTAEFSFGQNDTLARSVTWTLLKAIDHCRDAPKEFQEQVLRLVEGFNDEVYSSLVSSQRFASFPLDSHGWTNLGFLASMLAMTRDRLPSSAGRLANVVELYLNTFSPWGQDDGGFGNGSAYAYFAVAIQMELWDQLRASRVMDIYKHPWLRCLVDYLDLSFPENAQAGTFGNGSEQRSDRSIYEALRARILASSPGTLPCANSNASARWFKSSGEVVLSATNRFGQIDAAGLRLFLRASPYGSFNHAHPDQGSLIVNLGPQRLIGRSGAYDAYGSPHYQRWYKTTAAQSALTFDGDLGQRSESLAAVGRVIAVGRNKDFQWALTEAASAYQGLERAQRLVILKGSEQWLSLDWVKSVAPSIYKTARYNLHSPLARMNGDSLRQLEIADSKSKLCIRSLMGEAEWDEVRPLEVPLLRPVARLKTSRYMLSSVLQDGQAIIPVLFTKVPLRSESGPCETRVPGLTTPKIAQGVKSLEVSWGGTTWRLTEE